MHPTNTDLENRWFIDSARELPATPPGPIARVTPFLFFFGLGAIITLALFWAGSMTHLLHL